MQIGIHAPHLGRELDPGTVRSFVKECDALDVHSLWVSDHVCWPADIVSKYPYTDDGSFPASPEMGWLDPIGTLLFIAGCTDRVRLGTTVLILPYRPPVATAKQLATLDVVSNGRLILGVGIGWMAEEAAVLGMPWDHRGRRSDEQLEIFRRLFTEPEPSFQGEFYRFPKVGFEPKARAATGSGLGGGVDDGRVPAGCPVWAGFPRSLSASRGGQAGVAGSARGVRGDRP